MTTEKSIFKISKKSKKNNNEKNYRKYLKYKNKYNGLKNDIVFLNGGNNMQDADNPQDVDNNTVKYVIWIRHCESCAQIKLKDENFITKKFKREPLCKKNGIIQSYKTGYNIKSWLTKLNKNFPDINIFSDINDNSFNIFSSILPRTMETAKVISNSLFDLGNKTSNKTIKRLLYVMEKENTAEQIKDKLDNFFSSIKKTKTTKTTKTTQNTTTLNKSDIHKNFLNKFFEGIEIDNEIIPENTINNDNIIKSNNDDYIKFKSEILSDNNTIESKKFNIIVSHGRYIRENVLDNIKNKNDYMKNNPQIFEHTDNTQAFLIKYEKEIINNLTKENKETEENKEIINKLTKENIKIINKVTKADEINYDDNIYINCDYDYSTNIIDYVKANLKKGNQPENQNEENSNIIKGGQPENQSQVNPNKIWNSYLIDILPGGDYLKI